MNEQSKLSQVDNKQIRLTPKYEETYWTIKLGATKAELEEAIKAVGPMTDDVVKQLNARPDKSRLKSEQAVGGWLAPSPLKTVRG